MAVAAPERNAIIFGAVGMTGPIGEDPSDWNLRLKQNAKYLTTLLSEGSPVAKTIDMIDEAKKFVGTVLFVTKEPTSKRAFVVLKTNPSKLNEDGIETVRTEIVDWEGKSGEAYSFAKDLKSLTGHRVLLYVEMQTGKDDATRKFRILQHADDLGPDDSVTEDDYEAGKERARKDLRR